MASTYLSRSFSSPTNDKKFTLSAWCKFDKEGSGGHLFFATSGNSNTQWFQVRASGGGLQISGYSTGWLTTTRKFRDYSGWYHVLIQADSTQATASNRLKLFINGEQETDFSIDNRSSITQNQTWGWNVNSTTHYIGGEGNSGHYNGLMSHVHFVDGTCEAPTVFGEEDSTTGNWKLKTAPSVTYGNNGFFILKNGNSVTDQSGNSNNWTVANGNLTNTEDCPDNVFATWNPLWSQSNGNVGDVTFSNGNTTTTTSANYRTTPATLGMKKGKYYWEVKRIEDAGADLHAGIMSELATPANTATWIGNAANGWVNAGDGGDKYTGGTGGGSTGAQAANSGDIMMFAYDADNGKLYFGVNGSWGNSANPATGANPHYDSLDTTLFYFPCVSTGDDCSVNFGNGYFGTTAISSEGTNASGIGKFEYDVPAGFTALSTKGINSF